jgi:hypothetical protein
MTLTLAPRGRLRPRRQQRGAGLAQRRGAGGHVATFGGAIFAPPVIFCGGDH